MLGCPVAFNVSVSDLQNTRPDRMQTVGKLSFAIETAHMLLTGISRWKSQGIYGIEYRIKLHLFAHTQLLISSIVNQINTSKS